MLAVFGAIAAYIIAILVGAICRISIRKTAQMILLFAFNLAILMPILELFPFDTVIAHGFWKHVFIAGILLGVLWMTCSRLKLAKFLVVPTILTSLLLPISVLCVVQESMWSPPTSEGVNAHSEGDRNQQLPDIILLTIDALSAYHLHTYGYQRPTSPNLDKLAANAIVFDNFYANANWTRPGIASILDGVRPWTHEGDLDSPSRDLTERQNLLTILHAAGYDVNVVQSSPFADFKSQGIWLDAHKMYLDSSYRLFGWLPIVKLHSAATARYFGLPWVIERFEDAFLRRPEGKNLPYILACDELLRKASSRHPLFLWLHVITPHDPYAASAPFLGAFDASPDARTAASSLAYENFTKHIDQRPQKLLMARYDEAVLMTDNIIGEFIQMLKQRGLFDHSLIVLTADHGESFLPIYGAHGGPLLTEELIRVPCIIKPPSSYIPKHEVRLMEQADLLPTILSYAGLSLPAGSEGLPYQDKPEGRPVFSMNRDLQNHEHTLNVAMREKDWKYVIHLGRWKHPWPQQELYNLAEDPNEQSNLVNSQPAQTAAMRQRILAEIVRHGISLSDYKP